MKLGGGFKFVFSLGKIGNKSIKECNENKFCNFVFHHNYFCVSPLVLFLLSFLFIYSSQVFGESNSTSGNGSNQQNNSVQTMTNNSMSQVGQSISSQTNQLSNYQVHEANSQTGSTYNNAQRAADLSSNASNASHQAGSQLSSLGSGALQTAMACENSKNYSCYAKYMGLSAALMLLSKQSHSDGNKYQASSDNSNNVAGLTRNQKGGASGDISQKLNLAKYAKELDKIDRNLKKNGIKFDPEKNGAFLPDGSFLASKDVASSEGLSRLGVPKGHLGSALSDLQKSLNNVQDQVASQKGSSSGLMKDVDGFGGDGGGGSSAGSSGYSADQFSDPSKKFRDLFNSQFKNQTDSSIGGSFVEHNGDQIGVAVDNIFSMISRRYENEKRGQTLNLDSGSFGDGARNSPSSKANIGDGANNKALKLSNTSPAAENQSSRTPASSSNKAPSLNLPPMSH